MRIRGRCSECLKNEDPGLEVGTRVESVVQATCVVVFIDYTKMFLWIFWPCSKTLNILILCIKRKLLLSFSIIFPV